MKNLIQMSVSGILAFSLAFPALAQGKPKTLILQPQPGSYWQAEVIAENGPFYVDEKELTVKVNFPEIAKLIAKHATRIDREDENGFYREKRGFKQPQAIFHINHVDNSATTHTFNLAGEDPGEVVLKFSKPIWGLSSVKTQIIGQRDVFKCFDPNNCVFEKTQPKVIWLRVPSSFSQHRAIYQCKGYQPVEFNILKPEMQRMWIESGPMLNHLGIPFPYYRGGKGKPATNGSEFESFPSELDHFGTTPDSSGEAFKKLVVSKDKGGLKLLVTTKPHYFCHYKQTTGSPFIFKIATPLEQECTKGNEKWEVVGSSPGQEEASLKDWFIPNCEELP